MIFKENVPWVGLVGAWGQMRYLNFIVDATGSAAGHANNFKVKDAVSFKVNKKMKD